MARGLLGMIRLDQLIVTRNTSINARLESDESLKALVDDMQTAGQRDPITVIHSDHVDLYEVIFGFRRVEALRRLGRTLVKVDIVKEWPENILVIGTVGYSIDTFFRLENIVSAFVCPSCDGKGCGFCEPDEPHGQD